MKKAIKKQTTQTAATVEKMLAAIRARRKAGVVPTTNVEKPPVLEMFFNNVKVPIGPDEVGMFILHAAHGMKIDRCNTTAFERHELGSSFISMLKESNES